jgi:hypothetical protein
MEPDLFAEGGRITLRQLDVARDPPTLTLALQLTIRWPNVSGFAGMIVSLAARERPAVGESMTSSSRRDPSPAGERIGGTPTKGHAGPRCALGEVFPRIRGRDVSACDRCHLTSPPAADLADSRRNEGNVMHSAAHRSVTVVTLMTLIFTPMLKGHHWVNVLTGKTTETKIEQCKPGEPCPARKHITQKIVQP